MLSHIKPGKIAIFTAFAVSLYVLETFLPRPIPWLRWGFSNAFVLALLIQDGILPAFLVSIGKTFIGCLFTGTLFTPSLIFSLTGGISSLILMKILYFTGIFGIIGISIGGAGAHSCAQVFLSSILFTGRPSFSYLYPVWLAFSSITGTITGILAWKITERSERWH